MTIKIFIIQGILCLIIGFTLGKIYNKNSNKIVQTQTTQQKVITNQKEISKTNTQNNVKSEKQTITTQKVFSKTGKLKKETETRIVYNYVNLSTKMEADNKVSQIIDSELTKQSLIIEPEKNWSLGGFIPITNYKEYTDYTFQLSYRVYGQIWVSAQSNIIFTRPMIGIGVTF